MFSTPRRSSSGGAAEISTPQSAGVPATPRVNDDAAERRRRRKSAIERRRSNLVTPHRLKTKVPLFTQSPQLNSPGAFAVQLPRLTPEELNQRYEEWMKIAADNKINANNTWDFALIDYFYDMSLLRDGDSINFQKASCTLDGCVKIYSSRVDSVATETGRLLSGLADAPGKRGRRGGDGDDDGEDGEEDSGKQKTRRAARSANTLAKDFASISVKKLDLEFSVDPLFKKTSADFDEGGARGLLLNHLAFDVDGKIVFDASDSKALIGDEELPMDELDAVDEQDQASGSDGSDGMHEQSQEQEQRWPNAAAANRHKASLIDISSMDAVFDGIMQHIDEAEICPSLADFEFTRDTSLDFSLLKEHFRDDESTAAVSDTAGSISGDIGADDNGDFGDDMAHFLNFDEGETGPVPLETASTLQMAEQEEAQEHGMEQQEQGGMHGLLHGGSGQLALSMAEDEDNLLSYFDTKLVKSWAGPGHWQLPISRAAMQKQQQHPQPQDQQSVDGEASNPEDPEGSKRKRAEKQLYYTDFMNGPDVDAEALFAKPTRASMITMSKKAAMSQDHTLPEDVHFSSKNLFNLLLKPKLKFNPRRTRANMAAASAAAAAGGAGPDGSLGAMHAGGTDGYGGFVVDGDGVGNVFGNLDDGLAGDMDDARMGFDDGDDFDDDVLPMAAEGANEDSKPDVPQLRLIKPLYVNYARRAKRVNVKKLKDNIWREMASVDRRKSVASADMATDDVDEVKLDGDQKFSEIVGGLKNVYPREKLDELSVSFCFICLLHLANERNLRIVGNQSLSDLTISQDHFE
ncbi:hypothetical protein LPJ56_000991 [Coemansia sp. RSA 2599]|nr:hypothetical protein LPJ75_000554 [Coemansia sp. RSA 2598]KAJ1828633.1 hypothetical protein LPJ56_000991 [Coemansia sp. RSA 2599]